MQKKIDVRFAMSKPIFLIDIDGTIADFEKGREIFLRRQYPYMKVIPAEEITHLSLAIF